MRTAHPIGKNILAEKVVHNETSLILEETVTSNDMFDIVVVELGPDVKEGIAVGDMLICASGLHALPTCMKNHFIIHDSDVVGIEKAV